MINTNSPLESLSAFAIAFAAGVASTVALSLYTRYLRRSAQATAKDSNVLA